MSFLRKSACMAGALLAIASFAFGAGSSESTGAAPASGVPAATAPRTGIKFTPPVEMKLVLGTTEAFRKGETVNDNVLTRWALERLGIKMTYLWESTTNNSAYENKIRLELAAGSAMPDILYLNAGSQLLISDLISSGIFREAGSLFDAYASEGWKKAMAQEPTAFLPYTVAGKRMGVPVLDFAMHQESVMTVRQDWLDKLGLKAPTTLAELEAVFDAFTNKDPDGNGKKDTYGMALSLRDGFSNSYAYAGWLFGMFGTLNGSWNDWNGDGALEYGSVMPGAKQALSYLRSWMAKGYLHKEVGLWDGQKAQELIANGQAGVFFAPRWAHSVIEAPMKNDPSVKWKSYPLPVGPTGKVMRHASTAVHGVWLINKNFKTPEAFFAYQNYMMDNYASPSVGGEFENGMFEGYDYIMVDGKVSTSNNAFPKDAPRIRPYKHSLDSNGARIPYQRLEAYSKIYNKEPLVLPYDIKEAAGAKFYDIEVGAITLAQRAVRKENLFVGMPTATMQSVGELMNKLEQETFLKIVYSEEPLDAFDAFVKRWSELGGTKVTEEVNAWYKSTK
ncbi:MAG: Lipoprotein LipO precursor [Syntrophaceae bacterium PtaU1.Bin231]|nr:MAG: Lipoprotein LipO precursor [Syntrophaceae bacterium PtaU1.Bin231]